MYSFGRIATVFASLLIGIALAQAQVPAGYPADYKAILDGAKKEGKVVVYSTTDAKLVTPLIKDFEAAFPGVKVEYTDLNSTEVYNRFISENAANATSADAVWSSSMDLQMKLAADGLAHDLQVAGERRRCRRGRTGRTASTRPPSSRSRSSTTSDWCRPRTCPRPMPTSSSCSPPKPTSTRRRSPPTMPKKSGVGFMLVNQDAKLNPAFWDLVKAMGARGANMQSSTGTMMERVSSGENLIGYNILGSYALTRAKKDPSIGVAFTSDYNLVLSRLVFVAKNAKNPNAGKLWVDYLLSKRGQTIAAEQAELYFGAHRHDRQGYRRRLRQGARQRGEADRGQRRAAAGTRPDQAA